MSVGRHENVDASRDGSGQIQKKDCAYEYPFEAQPVSAEQAMGGWNRVTKPEGGMPEPSKWLPGMRGQDGDVHPSHD